MRAFVLLCLFGTADFQTKPQVQEHKCFVNGKLLYQCESPLEDGRGFNKTINDTQAGENEDQPLISQDAPQQSAVSPQLTQLWEADDDGGVGFSKPLLDEEDAQDGATM